MWTKQHYRFKVRDWLAGDPAQPPAPACAEASAAATCTGGTSTSPT